MQSGASKSPQQNRFRLIIGGVTNRYLPGPKTLRNILKKLVSKSSGSRFEAVSLDIVIVSNKKISWRIARSMALPQALPDG